ncbi:NACHT domain-containing protein [Cellulosimicrobium sp. 22601]|uniref:NACHT domain-containing protein n=1 Tax=unclassified Cellulosimicrobium TaxID=2624466 RepID=UPI003F879F50
MEDNRKWLIGQIESELKSWRDSTKRLRKPDYILIATNVRLSPYPGGGIDDINRQVEELAAAFLPSLKNFRVFHLDDIRTLLDKHGEIRRAYAAWVTPGDVISSLLDEKNDRERELRSALLSHAGLMLVDDNRLNLAQAGSASEAGNSMPEVFTDVPFAVDNARYTKISALESDSEEPDQGIVPHLVQTSDRKTEASRRHSGANPRVVLIGGPGQGKSTVTQYLAQVYRSDFLRDTSTASISNIRDAIGRVDESMQRLGVERPVSRRWPIRIIMTRLADTLSNGRARSLIEYIALLINERSGRSITSEDILKWLREYPWLLLIDGLDEVPDSSNRDEVLRVISDFFVEVATASADVVTVCTTRPQGYSNEFDPAEYKHLVLTKLPPKTAQAFADSFISLRNGANSDRANELKAKMGAALATDATARLMGSPLQVTIMVMLIERLGQAPSDRWRLFNQYYRVIFQREQEKNTPLATLLRDYESDIDAIHRSIGFKLQSRGAEAGGTSSSIDREDLEQAIVDRLTSQGHDPSEAEALRLRFSELVTDRLVFLATITSDRLGFEIRSLQEFMAGEYIVDLEPETLWVTVEEYARIDYWRNTILFAAGKIFADREILRDGLVTVCESLNWSGLPDALPMQGSTLALRILADGATVRAPKYERLLAERAILLLDGPYTAECGDFASIAHSSRVREVLVREIPTWDGMDLSALLNRAFVVHSLAERERQWAVPLLLDLVVRAPREARLALLGLASELESRLLFEILEAGDLDYTPNDFVLAESGFRFAGDPESVEGLGQLESIASLFRERFRAASETFLRFLPTASSSELQVVGLGDAHSGELFDVLSRFRPGAEEAWGPAFASGAFCRQPSAETLAAFFDACSATVEWDIGRFRVPWVLGEFLGRASYFSRAVGSAPEALSQFWSCLAAMARAGEFGELDDWLRAELRWSRDGFAILDETCPYREISVSGHVAYIPELRSVSEVGFPYFALLVTQNIGEQGVVEELTSVIEALLPNESSQADPWVQEKFSDLAFFLGSMATIALREGSRRGAPVIGDSGTAAEANDREQRLVSALVATADTPLSSWRHRWVHVAWLDLLSEDELERVVLGGRVDASARSNFSAQYESSDLAKKLLRIWCDNPSCWWAFRIALAAHWRTVSEEVRLMESEDVSSGLSGQLGALFRLFQGSTAALEAGALDPDLRAVFEPALGEGFIGQVPIVLFLAELPRDYGDVMRRRIVWLLSSEKPFVCQRALHGFEMAS